MRLPCGALCVRTLHSSFEHCGSDILLETVKSPDHATGFRKPLCVLLQCRTRNRRHGCDPIRRGRTTPAAAHCFHMHSNRRFLLSPSCCGGAPGMRLFVSVSRAALHYLASGVAAMMSLNSHTAAQHHANNRFDGALRAHASVSDTCINTRTPAPDMCLSAGCGVRMR